MSEIAILRAQARLITPSTNKAAANLDCILDRLGDLMPLAAFEDFCASLTRAHVGAGFVA